MPEFKLRAEMAARRWTHINRFLRFSMLTTDFLYSTLTRTFPTTKCPFFIIDKTTSGLSQIGLETVLLNKNPEFQTGDVEFERSGFTRPSVSNKRTLTSSIILNVGSSVF